MSTATQAPAPNPYDLDAPQRRLRPFEDRILGREAFYLGAQPGAKSDELELDREPRSFVIRRHQPENMYGGVEFRLQIGMRADFSIISAPFHSSARLNEGWTYMGKGKNEGKRILGYQYGPADRDVLAKLVQQHPELIAPLMFKKSIQYWPAKGDEPARPKLDYKKLFAVEMHEVLFEYYDAPDPQKPGAFLRKLVMDPATRGPKYTIDPQPWIWRLNDPWWEQLMKKILYPDAAKMAAPAAVADIDNPEAKAAPIKELPKIKGVPATVDQIVLKLWAKTDTEKSSGSDVRAKYIVDFSAGFTVNSLAVTPVNPFPATTNGTLDWDQIFPPMTQAQADKIVADAKKNFEELGDQAAAAAPDAEAGGGQQAEFAEDGPPPSDDRDIPF